MAKCLLNTFLLFVLVHINIATCQTLTGSNPLPPGANFDLNAWKLQTLDADLKFIEKTPFELETGYTSPFFYSDSTDGSMVFRVPSNGSSTANSSYPRVELRQVLDGANWSLSDQTEHYLTAEYKVISVAQPKPGIIIGQIHGYEDESELLKLRWTGYKPGQCYIEARFELNDATRAEYGVTLATGLSLGDLVSYTITMKAGKITIWLNGVSATQTYTTAYFGTTDTYYFKAGAYLQYNGSNPVYYGKTQFYKLSLAKQPQTISFNSLTTKKTGDPDFNPGAVASSGLAVSYSSSNTAVATIVGGNVHIEGSGSTLITASQAGNLFYNAAADVSRTLTVTQAPAGVDDTREGNGHFQLYPNPASDQIVIRFYLSEESKVSAILYDLTGRLVKIVIPEANQMPGEQKLMFSISDLDDGVYFVCIKNGNKSQTEKVIVSRQE